MKPDYRITLALAALLIVGALILPPWKHSIGGEFAGFHYVFSDIDSVNMLELDYAKLGLIVLGVTLTSVALHIFILIFLENTHLNNPQHSAKRVQSIAKRKSRLINDNYIIIKAIILLLLGIAVAIQDL